MAESTLPGRNQVADRYTAQPQPLGHAAHIATNILNQALALCAQEMALDGPEDVTRHVRQGQRAACAHLCRILTQQVAQALGTMDTHIRAVYTSDDLRLMGETSDVPWIDLLVWRQHRTAAFDAWVSALDRALVHAYRDATDVPELLTLLDVRVIEDGDAQKFLGCCTHSRASERLVAHLLKTRNELVDVAYEKRVPA